MLRYFYLLYLFLPPFIFLSYVIQYFYKPSPTLRLTYRRYFYWLLRNIVHISFLSVLTLYFNQLNIRFFSWVTTPVSLVRTLFNKGLYNLFTTPFTKWRPLLGNSCVKGFEYWSYSLGDKLLNPEVLPFSSQPMTVFGKNYFLNQSFLEKKYLSTPINTTYYWIVLSHFFTILLKTWVSWRLQFSYDLRFLSINSNHFILNYFNSRYFKMYLV